MERPIITNPLNPWQVLSGDLVMGTRPLQQIQLPVNYLVFGVYCKIWLMRQILQGYVCVDYAVVNTCAYISILDSKSFKTAYCYHYRSLYVFEALSRYFLN